MKRLTFVMLLTVFFCSLPCQSFAEYSELIGKELKMQGPYSWQRLGVALNKNKGDDLIYAYRMYDKDAFTALLASYDVLRVPKDTKVFVLDEEILRGRAHVVITTGIYEGMSGWIPVEWLKQDSRQSILKEGGQG